MLILIFQHNPGSGTCDGTFRNQQYFKCAPNSAVFVRLDELEPLEDNSESKLDSGIPSFFKGKSDPKLSHSQSIEKLMIVLKSTRVVIFGDLMCKHENDKMHLNYCFLFS